LTNSIVIDYAKTPALSKPKKAAVKFEVEDDKESKLFFIIKTIHSSNPHCKHIVLKEEKNIPRPGIIKEFPLEFNVLTKNQL
jgi:hypothetical protein